MPRRKLPCFPFGSTFVDGVRYHPRPTAAPCVQASGIDLPEDPTIGEVAASKGIDPPGGAILCAVGTGINVFDQSAASREQAWKTGTRQSVVDVVTRFDELTQVPSRDVLINDLANEV